MTVAPRPAQTRQAAPAARTCRATRAGVLVLALACAAGTATFAAPGTRQGTARATPDDAGVEQRDDAPAERAVPGDDDVPTRRAVPGDDDDDVPMRRAVPGDGAPAGRPVSPAAAAPDAAAMPDPAPVAVPASNYENQRLRRSKLPASRPSTTQKSAGAAGGGAAAARQATTGFDAARVVTALGVVLGLILPLKWFGRRFFAAPGAGRSTRAVQVVSRSPLSPRQQLVLLRVGRRLLVVADGGGQMNTLSEITDPDEVAALLGQLQDDHADRATKSFGSLFGKMRGAFERDGAAAGAGDETDDNEAVARGRGGGGGDHDRDDRLLRLGERRFRRDADDDDDDHDGGDPAVESTRQELSGLVDKVRRLSSQFKSP